MDSIWQGSLVGTCRVPSWPTSAHHFAAAHVAAALLRKHSHADVRERTCVHAHAKAITSFAVPDNIGSTALFVPSLMPQFCSQ